jgi:ribose transport system ATP-binding protein
MYELKAVEKKFPGVHALKSVDFHVKRGEIVGLVGENGAGKSTLMKVIYGAYQPDGGTIQIDGRTVRFQNPRQAMERGIGMVFQEQSLIANLTVMENIYLGYEAQFVRFGVIQWRAMAEAARKQLAKVRLDIDPAIVTSSLSFAQRQLVELAKVLTLEERVDGDLVILLDEPTSVLAADGGSLGRGLRAARTQGRGDRRGHERV